MPAAHPVVSWKRLALSGFAATLLVLLAGIGLEYVRYGANAADTTSRLVAEVRGRLAAQDRALRAAAARLMAEPDLAAALYEGAPRARTLFTLLERAGLVRPGDDSVQAITLYSADDQVLAWMGRPSTLPVERLHGPSALFVTPGPLGLRLVYVAPVMLPAGGRRAGVIATEYVLSPASAATLSDTADYAFPTSLVSVTLVPRYVRSADTASQAAVVLRGASGEPLLEVRTDPDTLAEARRSWRATTYGIAAAVLVATLLLVGASVARWRIVGTPRQFVIGSVALCVLFLVARWVLWWSLPPSLLEDDTIDRAALAGGPWSVLLRSPVDILAHGLLGLGIVAVAIAAVERARRAWRTRRREPDARPSILARFVAMELAIGVVSTALVGGFEVLLRQVVEYASIDVMHLSFHPYDHQRLALLVGLMLLHAAVVWAAVAVLLAGLVPFRLPRARAGWRLILVACWSAPAAVFALGGVLTNWNIPRAPLLLTVASAGLLALLWRRTSAWFRHASEGGRVLAAMLMLIVPSVLLYPSLADVAERSRQQWIEERFATETLALPRTLLARLDEARQQVDRLSDLDDLLLPAAPGVRTDTAFAVWRRTALATWRLTSAVEIYDAAGTLVSRFALNLPEYEARNQRYQVASCRWAVFGEAAPFGAEERRMLHAERGICDDRGRVVGTLVLHVLPDYTTLSFISSQNPYFEMFSGRPRSSRDDLPGNDVGLVIYGWGRSVLFTTTGRAWPLDDRLFGQLYRSNEGFWTQLSVANVRSRVYFVSDRNGIYALAYAVSTWFDHSVHLAELVTLAVLASVIALLVATVLQRLAWREAWTGRELLRELRTSFSRKLFLAFVGATTIPVLILAFATRTYVASRLRHDIEAEASRTAAVAQRVIEETISLDRRAEVASSVLDDDALVWISRIISHDVNIYDGPQLIATSERDLFASGQLPTRTPDGVYRAIAIDRLPSYVGEDEVAGLRYLTAAAPVRAGNRDAVLTVPFTLRQREIEREIDELDRGVQLGALVFILLGASVGYWLAERISDPVQRLTRASRRIAAGDLDTRVFVRSADELRRLVEAFNKMAWELQRQRVQLERTNRLEAWAEMARQVAHDIKNPLTPIQLSAEHLRRVHRDRGVPLGPVLDGCVDTILAQVRLLRQIAGEFSSFASTPVARPVSTDVRELLEEVVRAYETGLSGRVTFVVDVAADVPSLSVDRTLIGRAITNVVENALHAMPSGGTVTLAATRAGDGATVTISDSGMGMDEEALGRIFEPYFSTKATGTGLGLTIAKRNIELHGGRIAITSQRGHGTSVSFTLPATSAVVSG